MTCDLRALQQLGDIISSVQFLFLFYFFCFCVELWYSMFSNIKNVK